MRVGEVLKLKPHDIGDPKVIIRDPKSGKEAEVVSPLHSMVSVQILGLINNEFDLTSMKLETPIQNLLSG